jgi:hypothetical protein
VGVGGGGSRLLFEELVADISGAAIVSPPRRETLTGGVAAQNEYRSTHPFDTTFIMLSFIVVIHRSYSLFVACTQHLPCVCG